MKRFVAVLSLLLAPFSAVQAQTLTEAEQGVRWERGQTSQRRFEHGLFTRAGFVPMAEVMVEGRDVRRLLLHDPYGMLPVPGIELERLSDGRVALRLQYRGWTSEPVLVESAAWVTLARQEPAVFASAAFQRAGDQPAPASPPPVCHGWIARLAADQARTASWAECGGGVSPAYKYALDMVQLAVGTKQDCSFEPGNPFWSFNKCFAPKAALDDTELEAKFSVLRTEFDQAPAAERLAQARRALNVPDLTLGSKAWFDARAAIAKFKEVHDLRRERLQQLQQLAYGASQASDADKAKMRQTIEHWLGFVRSQEPHYSDLLQRLAWAGG